MPTMLRYLFMICSTLTCLASNITSRCTAPNVKFPHIPGTNVLGVYAQVVENHTLAAPLMQSMGVSSKVTIDFCNVTIHYGHWGWADDVEVSIWLPLYEWNDRLVGVGGGGLSSLMTYDSLALPVSKGYSTVGTNAGHVMEPANATSWALDGASKVNFFLLQNNFAVSQNEASIIAKEVVRGMYGRGPQYSYWDGCSTGGRQGLMLAQDYPDAYDGILAGAPAINWAIFVPSMYYPQFVMNQLQHFPDRCALSAFTDAAVEACDHLDGVIDGILSHPEQCLWSPRVLVGKEVTCGNQSITVSAEDALVMEKIWEGPKNAAGQSIWFGMSKSASASDLVNTACHDGHCEGVPFPIASDWIKLFVLQNRTSVLTTLPSNGFEAIVNLSNSAYRSVTSTDNPDLSAFQQSGGKLLHWHGTADQQIFQPGSTKYYNSVETKNSDLRDFYRYFEAPGVSHCGGGHGLIPQDPFSVLVDWVERGVTPDHLPALTHDGELKRNLCPYPLVPAYKGGDPKVASSFKCSTSYGMSV